MTMMTRTACLVGALLVLAGDRLTAQDLLFGSEPLPRATANSRKVLLTEEGQSWEIRISREGVGRLIQIAGLGSEKNTSATLVCSSSSPTQLDNKQWVVAKGDCLLRFKPEVGAISADVKLMVAAAAVESSTLSNLPSDDQLSKADQDSVRVTLILEGATPSGANDPSNGRTDSTLADRLRRPILLGGVVVVLAFSISFFLWKYGKLPFLPPLKPAVATSPGRQEGTPLAEQTMQATAVKETLMAVEKTLELHTRQLLEMRTKTIAEMETRIQQVAENCTSMLIAKDEEAARQLLDIRKEGGQRLQDIENRLSTLEDDLSGHLTNQSSRLQDLFKDLPTLAELRAPARDLHEPELSRLEGLLMSAAKQVALSGITLDALQAESRSLVEIIDGFVPAAAKLNKEKTTKRLGLLSDGAKILNNELSNLGQLASAQKYGFFVEMSLLEQNPLSRDLAAALTREVAKVTDPEGYYRKRLGAMKVQVCVAAIDLADLDLDAERRNLGLQDALARLIQALGMTQIDPRQNDKLQAAEHQVVQFVRRVPGALPGAIAHTVARGLQRGNEPIRRASVLLYE